MVNGAYGATSEGKMYLEPDAFDVNFPAQVKLKIDADCLTLPEFKFQSAIQDNYQKGKFSQEQNKQQVRDILSLFWPFTLPMLAIAPPKLAYSAVTEAMLVPAVVPPTLSLAAMAKAMPSTAMEKQYHSQARVPIHDIYEPRDAV